MRRLTYLKTGWTPNCKSWATSSTLSATNFFSPLCMCIFCAVPLIKLLRLVHLDAWTSTESQSASVVCPVHRVLRLISASLIFVCRKMFYVRYTWTAVATTAWNWSVSCLVNHFEASDDILLSKLQDRLANNRVASASRYKKLCSDCVTESVCRCATQVCSDYFYRQPV